MSLTVNGPGTLRATSANDADLPALLEFQSPTNALAIEPVLYAARPVTLMVCTLVGACFAAAALVPIDKVVSAQGKIIALDATTVVQPLETAIVRSIQVHEGDRVRKGQLLARLDPTFATADRGALQSQVASLGAEVARLEAESDGEAYAPTQTNPNTQLQRAIFEQRRADRRFKIENYNQKITGLQAQILRTTTDVNAYTERLRIAADIEARRKELEQDKVGSVLNRLQAQDTRLEVKRGLDGAIAQQLQLQGDLQAMTAERDAYAQNWSAQVSQQLTEQARKLSDARENLAKADLRHRLVELRADEDATVLNIAKVSPGSVMQSGEQLLTLVPLNAPLEAEVNVPGSEAGYVHPGNDVTLKLDTLPYTQYGTIDGLVRYVSPDSFSTAQEDQQPKRGSQPSPPRPLGSSYYRTRITLDSSHLRDTPAGFHLMPGMPVTADVKVGQRTLASYLFSRVLPAFMDGMREP